MFIGHFPLSPPTKPGAPVPGRGDGPGTPRLGPEGETWRDGERHRQTETPGEEGRAREEGGDTHREP